jgi:hypothetical protein
MLYGPGKRRHIATFEKNRSHVRMLGHQPPGPIYDFLFYLIMIEFTTAVQDVAKLRLIPQSHDSDRYIGSDAASLKQSRSYGRGIRAHDAHSLSWFQRAVKHRYLKQAGKKDRNIQRSGYLALIVAQITTGTSNRTDSLLLQFPTSFDDQIHHCGIGTVNPILGAALQHFVQHRKIVGRSVYHIAWQERVPYLQMHNAYGVSRYELPFRYSESLPLEVALAQIAIRHDSHPFQNVVPPALAPYVVRINDSSSHLQGLASGV